MIEGDVPGSERQLSPGDRRFLWLCLLVAAVSLIVGFYLFPKVNSEASIRFDLDRGASERVALEFLAQQGFARQGQKHASSFVYDDEAKVFLERTLGVERSNEVMDRGLRMWRWGHRWFRPLEKEEWRVEVATTGGIAGFEHLIPEESAGPSLSQEEARHLAESFLSTALKIDPAQLDFLDARTEKRPRRADHTFIWKSRTLAWNTTPAIGQAGSSPAGSEGSYRYEVRIQGDRPGLYREYVKAPEVWKRDYQSLRSKNESTAAVASALLVLTMVAVIIVLLQRMRLGDVRWGTAGTYAWIGTVLTILAALNSLPANLYDYDTTQSFSNFVILRIFSAVVQGLGIGALILVLVGAGESLYREAYPTKLSLTRFFSPRGVRTRRFLLSAVLGLTLTCFFFAYQEVFYFAAKSFGAWAPMDVPYNDLFNTAFPWIFVLLIGFLPSVIEESMSRMFSIPLLQKLTRSRWIAILLPAFIWGFAHSNYPNQPFYIRGLEVGLAGVLIGLIMVRVNIGSTLIWHFTVDALYTSVLLYNSKNIYYIVSATLAGCVILLPIAYAVWSYRRHGGFELPDGLLNSDEGPAALPVSVAPAEPDIPVIPPRSGRSRGLTIAGVALASLLFFVPATRLEAPELQLSRPLALEQARFHLRTVSEEPDSFRTVVNVGRPLAGNTVRYVLQQGGPEALAQVRSVYDTEFRWQVRFYQPLSPKEVLLEVEPREGRLVRLRRDLAERDSLPSLPAREAEAAARAFLLAHQIDTTALALTESSVERRPRRLDHTFIWEAVPGDPRNIGEARHRVKVVVQGNEVGEFERWLKLPEHWIRERDARDLAWAGRLLLTVLAAGGLLGLLIWRLVIGHRSGETRWARSMMAASPVAVLALAASLNAWPKVMLNYDTSVPANVFFVTAGVGVAVGVLLSFFLSTAAIALATTCFPGGFALRHAGFRRALLFDAVLAAALMLVCHALLDHLEAVLLHLAPTQALLISRSEYAPAGALVPWLDIVTHAVRMTVFAVGIFAGVLSLAREWKHRPVVLAGAILLGALVIVPMTARGGEIAWGYLAGLLNLGAGLLVARYILRDNLLAYPLALFLGFSLQGLLPFLGASGEWFRSQGTIAAVVLSLPLVALLVSAARARR